MEDNLSTMHVRLVAEEPRLISSVGIEMNVEPNNDFAQNYYYHEGANENEER